MPGRMVRIDAQTHATLQALARPKKLSLTATLARAVELYRRAEALELLQSEYAAIADDPKAWGEELAERDAMGAHEY